MPRFTVTQNYSAERAAGDLTRFGPWQAGDEVEVDQADADWVNADSDGTLVPAKAKSDKPTAKKSTPKPAGDAHSTADAGGLTKDG